MIKDILVSLSVGRASSDAVVDYAISVATSFDAHLTGIALTYQPHGPGSVFNGMAADIVASYRAQIEKAGRDAVTKFDAAARHAGVSAQSQLLQMELAVIDQLFAETARRFDLSVVGQTKPGQEFPEEILPETALFGSGRPVLVVPYIQKTAMKLDRVLVCWDGSRAAARAL